MRKSVTRRCQCTFHHSLLLTCSILAVLSLLLMLRTIHLLHSDRVVLLVPQLHSDPSADQSAVDRWSAPNADWRLWGQKCLHPHLNPADPSVMQFYKKAVVIHCSATEAFVYVTKGTIRISRRARDLYGNITCVYIPLMRLDDFTVRDGPKVKPMEDGYAVQSDFFKVACESSSGNTYFNIHSAVAWNPAVWARLTSHASDTGDGAAVHSHASDTGDGAAVHSHASDTGDGAAVHSQHLHSIPPHQSSSSSLQRNKSQHDQPRIPAYNSLNLSVFMFGFGSLSRMAWIRHLPHTRDYFLRVLEGTELTGYNVVGDGTPAALLPILTGQMEEELPEARRGFSGALPVDNHPWVWRNFSQRGYVTTHAEDMSNLGAFQRSMLGFQDQPTDHNMSTFYREAERLYKRNRPLCLGSRPRHVNFMNWFRDLFHMYRHFPKFFFGFHSELNHTTDSLVQALDDDLVTFLKDLEEGGHLNSTLLILMADHGARFSFLRATAQGRLEERMPYFSFRFPPWFRKAHPEIIRNMEVNSQRLTTPFDIHATLLEVLNFTGAGMADINHRGLSLFQEVPKERTCSHAGITPHWCACLAWQPVNQSDDLVMQAVQSAITVINEHTDTVRRLCAKLSLLKVTHSVRYVPGAKDLSLEHKVFTYKSPRLASSRKQIPAPRAVELYQISFKTFPGRGHFEVTCSRDLTSGSFNVSAKKISRINKYGTQSYCIQDTNPHLRSYCYCARSRHARKGVVTWMIR